MNVEWNFVDIAFGLILLFSLVGGLLKGFTWQLVRITFLVVAFVLAHAYCEWLGIQIRQITNEGIGPPVDKGVGYVLIFSIVYLGSWPLAMLMRSVIAKLKLKSFDRMLGGLLGVLKGAAICYAIFVMAAFLVQEAYPDGSRLEEELGSSFSQDVAARVDPVVHGLLPDEFHAMMQQLRDKVEDTLDGPTDTPGPGSGDGAPPEDDREI